MTFAIASEQLFEETCNAMGAVVTSKSPRICKCPFQKRTLGQGLWFAACFNGEKGIFPLCFSIYCMILKGDHI